MTINIALATYDGIILGCDSLSSVMEPVMFPFRGKCVWARDANGDLIMDGNGNPMISAMPQNLVQVATTVFGGVNKMFHIFEDDDNCVAALTAGMATIGGVTIAEQAKRYRRERSIAGAKFTTVEAVARDFLGYMHALWAIQFKDTPADQRGYLPSVTFLMAGFGKDDAYGKIFKVDVASQACFEQFPDGDHMGLSWSGQADYVERLVHGIDTNVRVSATRGISEAIAAQRESTLADISGALTAAGVTLPDDLSFEVTEHVPASRPWDNCQADIDYGNLSTQYAVELVEMLVNTQSGMQRFARGIPTVGGRTHIGVLKRGEQFRLLNGPELEHRHTGYGHES